MSSREPVPGASEGVPGTGEPVVPRPPPDPVGVVAVVLGFVGIVVFGIALGIVTAIVGSIAGQRAREQGRSLELAYLAMLLAAVDGAVWIVMQILFPVPIVVG